MESKSEHRKKCLLLRQSISSAQRAKWDSEIFSTLMTWVVNWLTRRANPSPPVLGVYWPIRQEPDCRALYPALVLQGVRLALPAVIAPAKAMVFLAWSAGEIMIKDYFGIPIPASRQLVMPEVWLIPCLGFNRENYRLGYGAGMVDKTLATIYPKPVTLGVAYTCGYINFEAAPYDVALDGVVTESGLS